MTDRGSTRTDIHALVQADTAFALDLYGRLLGDGGNLFFSPYSVTVVLAMAHAGARGDTAEEMAAVLRRPLAGESLAAARAELDRRLRPEESQPDRLELRSANALWGQEGYPFRAEFLDALVRHHGAGVHLADFRSAPASARDAINAWVEDETNGKITHLVDEAAVNEATRLLLANAVYFRARWARQFDPAKTEQETFHLLDGTEEVVPMMHAKGIYRFARFEGARGIRLPYAGGASMLVIVPDRGHFEAVERRLAPDFLARIEENLAGHEVDLGMPRFEFTWEASLVGPLTSLGMKRAFTPPDRPGGADFTGMNEERDLFVGGVAHKAYVGVDEEGTEAAAATAIGVAGVSKPIVPPAELTIDRPFLFAIQGTDTGEILFLGRVLNPTS